MTSPTLQKIREDRKARHARFIAATYVPPKPPAPPAPPPPDPPSGIEQTKLWGLVQVAEASDLKTAEPYLPSPMTFDAIVKAVGEFYAIHPRNLVGRHHISVRARRVAIYLTRTLTNLSLSQIGRLFDKRDHTTIAFSVHKTEGLIRFDPELRREVEAIKRGLEQ